MDTTTTVQPAAEETHFEELLSDVDDLIAGAISIDDEGDASLAIRSISW